MLTPRHIKVASDSSMVLEKISVPSFLLYLKLFSSRKTFQPSSLLIILEAFVHNKLSTNPFVSNTVTIESTGLIFKEKKVWESMYHIVQFNFSRFLFSVIIFFLIIKKQPQALQRLWFVTVMEQKFFYIITSEKMKVDVF